jgi:TusA-related sulfurtransferase
MPIVKISQTMRKMESGDTLAVEATDPAFKADLEAWARRFGHEITSFEQGDCLRAVLVKS